MTFPSIYKHRRCIIYNREDPGWDDNLRSALGHTIHTVLAAAMGEDELGWPYDTSTLKEPTSVGVMIASADSRKVVIRGAKVVRDTIASAYGPRGSAVAISQIFGGTRQFQRGSQIAYGIKSSNPLEEKGIEQIRAAASSVYDSTGDGSKLASILTAGLMSKGQEMIDKDFHPKDVLNSMSRQIDRASKHLSGQVRRPNGAEVRAVATTAAGGDKRTGQFVAEAMRRVGKNGTIAIETSSLSETNLELREGLRFDQGYLSEYFVTNADTLECVLEQCLILFHEGRIQSMKDLVPLLEQVARADKSLLIIADDVEGEALATLTLNKIKGTLRCAAVKAPGFADRRKALMEDIAVLTGGKFLSLEFGLLLPSVSLEVLGKAEKVIITAHDTTIIGAGGSIDSIRERSRSVQTQITNSLNAYDKEKLQDRLARLAGGVAVLKAGGVSETDISHEKYKLESALHAARSAVQDGYVIGGGIALLRASFALRAETFTDEIDTEAAKSIASILEEPIRQLIANAKKSPTQILQDIAKITSVNYGFNAENCQVEDLLSAGVLDAAAPIELALRVALSHAGSILQTGTWDLSPPPVSQQRPPGQAPSQS